jgi:hypothetical protein
VLSLAQRYAFTRPYDPKFRWPMLGHFKYYKNRFVRHGWSQATSTVEEVLHAVS